METKFVTDTLDPRTLLKTLIAFRDGDFSARLPVDQTGVAGKIADTLNEIFKLNERMASEFARISGAVGKEGKINQRATLGSASGRWADCLESVNGLIGDLVQPSTEVARVIGSVAKGDLSQTMALEVDGRSLKGEFLHTARVVNTMVAQLNSFASEVTRVAREVGTEGELGGQAVVKGVGGVWKDLTDSVNSMAGNLTAQVRNIAEVTTAVANGDLSRKITVDVQGEILELKITINTMVDQLGSFASAVTRVAREVGTEGELGGQAEVKGVAGVWKDLTDSVNSMAGNLTAQVRNIAEVTTAVANGDLSRKITVDVQGEILELKNTINTMVDQLNAFASEVTRVAREVGTEGILGGQAEVKGVAGTWKDLTESVNSMAGNLTTQVRAIADVATAVTKGDLTRSIAVEALGEVAALKDNINEMIVNLAETTRKNTDQDWLKTNIAKFTGMMQGQRDLLTVTRLLLSELTPLVGAQLGTFYVADSADGSESLKLLASYGSNGSVPFQFGMGQGLVGQCGSEKRRILVTDVPKDYVKISSSLGEGTPLSIVVLPVLFEGEARAVIELASFRHFTDVNLAFLDQLTQGIGIVLNTIAATMRTEQLLQQSQALAEQLQKTNAELEEKAHLLAEQKNEVETKNREVEQAKAALEEKAEQLSLTSKYKSEFLANMSHELRTPLNNLLILAQMLSENGENTLTPKQVKYADTIHSSGTDLLALINDILDLSKIESGKMDVEVGSVRFGELHDLCVRTFRHVADGKGIEFTIDMSENLPSDSIITDAKRLQQVLKNLLSNALKFTEHGTVQLRMERATSGWSPNHAVLNRVKSVIAFSVTDTGIGIPQDKQRIIFEAFQQADGTTSRKYGGTGLGLSISRELTRLLGGEIRLQSAPGTGSTFTLYLPQTYVAQVSTAKGESPKVFPAGEAARTIAIGSNAANVSAEEVDMILPPPPSAPAVVVHDIEIDDDRNLIHTGDPVLLIIEDDVTFARILIDLAHDRGIRALVALRGGTALTLAREFNPGAITLDINLPDMAGWTILDRLKHDPATRHIPVHVISGDENRRRGLALGALTYLEKSITKDNLNAAFDSIHHSLQRRTKKLLIVADDEVRRANWQQLLGGDDVEILAVGSGAEALAAVKQWYLDGLAIDLRIADIPVAQLVEEIQAETSPQTPPIVLSGLHNLTAGLESDIRRLARSSAVRFAESNERLLEEAVLMLHRAETDLSEDQRGVLATARRNDATLAGKKVLVVDDDVRNIFALTSVLEQHNLQVVHAENGRAGIETLLKTPGVDGVLMDIMMPEMDGYETMRAIRKIAEFRTLPIIAVTAKAMKGDRAKCIEAGASDYITKPVDLELLFSVLRVWLVRSHESSQPVMTANS